MAAQDHCARTGEFPESLTQLGIDDEFLGDPYSESGETLKYRRYENKTTVYDFHATILHLLGLDHRRLTFYHNGLERRLTDVHGNVIHDVLV